MKRNQGGFGTLEIILVLAILLTIGLVGWLTWDRYSSNKQQNTESSTATYSGGTNSVEFKKLYVSSAPFSGQDIKSRLIKDQATLDRVWQEIYKDNTLPVIPRVDFKTNTLVLVTYSAPSGGYLISISKVVEGSNGITVDYRVNRPGEDCTVTDSLVLNYELATIPATTKTAAFSRTDGMHTCKVLF